VSREKNHKREWSRTGESGASATLALTSWAAANGFETLDPLDPKVAEVGEPAIGLAGAGLYRRVRGAAAPRSC
jgi:hypothetical protein